MTNKYFDLEIISTTSKESLVVEWIDVQGIGGNFLVGPDHRPLVSILSKDSPFIYKKYESEFTQKIMIISGGIFKVENNKAIVLLDS